VEVQLLLILLYLREVYAIEVDASSVRIRMESHNIHMACISFKRWHWQTTRCGSEFKYREGGYVKKSRQPSDDYASNSYSTSSSNLEFSGLW